MDDIIADKIIDRAELKDSDIFDEAKELLPRMGVTNYAYETTGTGFNSTHSFMVTDAKDIGPVYLAISLSALLNATALTGEGRADGRYKQVWRIALDYVTKAKVIVVDNIIAKAQHDGNDT